MIYYVIGYYNYVYADFESAKNKMYNLILENIDYSSDAKSMSMYGGRVIDATTAYELINLIEKDSYEEIVEIIMNCKSLQNFIVKKRITKKYSYKNKKINLLKQRIYKIIKNDLFK